MFRVCCWGLLPWFWSLFWKVGIIIHVILLYSSVAISVCVWLWLPLVIWKSNFICHSHIVWEKKECFWFFSQSCCSFASQQHCGNEVLGYVGPADPRWHYFTRLFCCCIQEIAHAYVPDSCCTLNFNQDRELYWVDPQNIQLKDAVRCQEDAAGRIGNSANLHQKVLQLSAYLYVGMWWSQEKFAFVECEFHKTNPFECECNHRITSLW